MKRIVLLSLVTLLSGCLSDNTVKPLIAEQKIKRMAPITTFAGHWLTEDTIVVAPEYASDNLQLIAQKSEKIEALALTAKPANEHLIKQYPHLASFKAYTVDLPKQQAKEYLKHRLFLAGKTKNEIKLTSLQTSYLLDVLYTLGNNDADEEPLLGATLNNNGTSFKLWAPTALEVELSVFDQDKQLLKNIAMSEDTNTGIWQHNDPNNLSLKFYQYQVTLFHPVTQQLETFTVTDPYSFSLSANSLFSQVIDLNSEQSKPKGWSEQKIPKVAKPEDLIIYETHIADFSGAEQQLSNEEYRSKYKAFSETNSNGIKHLTSLKTAGVNVVHLLPTFDLATINENPEKHLTLEDTIEKVCNIAKGISVCQQELDDQLTLKQVLSSYDPTTADAQALVSDIRIFDNYNWGYDPFHYTVPEGSYAVNPDGQNRIIEFREMVQSLHNMGFRVIMDVVYNHTHAARLQNTAVLDKIVPNYYQRLTPFSGLIEQSTCCDNTATERTMMAKLMVDSLIVWARDYKIDGFRFDLMGHQPKQLMLDARVAVQEIDSDTYFYGEGWNFGEVANNAQFIQASQNELAGTEIGTFTDRLRDAVRGSSFNVSGFDNRKNQGIGNGLGTLPNEMASQNNDYQEKLAQIRIGLAGNLANFPLKTDTGITLGKEVNYGGSPAGYALDPADTINYVSKHDNQTLWDNAQYRTAYTATKEQRVRMHNQSLSFAILAQGIPFLHMGSELIRSKSFLRDSYDYGDWFNYVDYSMQSNNYFKGLPPAEKDEANWPLIRELIEKNEGRDMVSPQDIAFANNTFQDFISIRANSELFRLGSEAEVIEKLSFLNNGANNIDGLIAMHIDDTKGEQVDENYTEILVLFNHSPETIKFSHSKVDDFKLHPRQVNGKDSVVQQTQIEERHVVVPAFTTAVLVKQ